MPPGALRLATKTHFYPYFYQSADGSFHGVYLEFWATMTKYLGFDALRALHYENIRFCNDSSCTSYYDGSIARQEVLTSALPVFLLPSDVHDYKYSVNVNWMMMHFFESAEREGLFTKASSIEFYTVFPIWMLILIIALQIISDVIFKLIDYLRGRGKRTAEQNPIPVQVIDFFSRFFILYAFYFANVVYQSYFNGNNVIFEERTSNFLSQLATQVSSGRRNLVFETGSTNFDNDDLTNMFGSSDVGIYEDLVLERLTMVCRNSSLVGFFYDVDLTLLSVTPSLQDCALIAPDAAMSRVPWLSTTMLNGDAYNFVFSRNVSSRVVEKINFALLSVYTAENFNQLFAYRAMSTRDLRQSMRYVESITPQSNAIARAISLTSLLYPLIFLAIGLSCSAVAFVLEVLYKKWSKTRR